MLLGIIAPDILAASSSGLRPPRLAGLFVGSLSMYYVYILQSKKDSKFYIGHSEDVARRLIHHNSGNVTATKHRRPFIIFYTESCDTRSEAIKRENYIKSLKGGNTFKKIIESGYSK